MRFQNCSFCHYQCKSPSIMKTRMKIVWTLAAVGIAIVLVWAYWYFFTIDLGTYRFNKIAEELERRAEYAQDPNNPYDPNIFALESSRGELKDSYFGIRLDELPKDASGNFIMTDAQRDLFIRNVEGTHLCSLQWISWENFGSVELVSKGKGALICKGGQKSIENNDYLEIDGILTPVSPIHLIFKGTIVTCVEHINNGKPVVRTGEYNFTVEGARVYWRMQEINNPADGCADYIDIFFG